ncbi:MAG: non-homologous end-joining DNA ligase [Kofleriaceae bacterium]
MRMRRPRALQLATLVDAPPEGPEWVHEQKFDGYRILAEVEGGRARLLSRRFKDWTAEFPTIAEALASLSVTSAMLDGEVAVLLPDGRTSFQGLQNSFGKRDPNLVYFVFDLLAENGDNLTGLPLEQRKARLEQLVKRAKSRTIHYSDHIVGRGHKFFALACKTGLEGIISKRRDKPYQPGRGATWQKTKCVQRQEFVIGGFTDPEGSRTGIGALLVGTYDKQRLTYAGKVGTGFSHALLGELREMFDPIERQAAPFDPVPARAWTGPNRHWVEPRLVCEVKFGEWTDDGRLRHPSFQGLRLDKSPSEVVRERAKS